MTQGLIDQLRQHIGEQGSDINKLERQLFIAERTIAEQNVVIESDYFALACIEYRRKLTEQSELIEKLAEALETLLGYSGFRPQAEEALTTYESWKGKV